MESETSYTYMSGVRGKVSTHCLGKHIGDPTKDLNSYNWVQHSFNLLNSYYFGQDLGKWQMN